MIKKKIKYAGVVLSTLLYSLPMQVAAATPKVDTGAAEDAAGSYIKDLTTIGMWLVPIVTILVLIVTGVVWMSKDEDEKEQKPFMKSAKKIIFVALFIEFAQAVLKILGIA